MTILTIGFALLAVLIAFLIYYIWWVRPRKLAIEHAGTPRDSRQRIEDFYRTQASKGLGGLLALAGFVVTAEQAISVQVDAVKARQKTNQLIAYDHHQKALDALTKPSSTPILHVGSIYALGALAGESPALATTIANELAITAASYATPQKYATQGGTTVDIISQEAQAALEVIGNLGVMEAGLPLQLRGGHFESAALPKALLNGVDMPNANLRGSNLYGAHLYNANLRFTDLSGTNLSGALLTNAAFYGAILCEGSNLTVSNLETVSVVPVQLSGAKMDGATFERAWLVGAVMGGGPEASGSDRPNITGANFTDASLLGADLSHALLDRANFSGTDLTDANLTGSSLEGIITSPTTYFCRTRWSDGKQRSDSCPNQSHDLPSKHPPCIKGSVWRTANTGS